MVYAGFILMLCCVLSICVLHLILQITSAGVLSTMIYLEHMYRLPETAPCMSISEAVTFPSRINRADSMLLEVTSINISSKCSDGVIGHAKQKQYLAQWDLIYHEVMAVQNLHRESSGMIKTTHESVSHHASSQAVTARNEYYAQAMMRGAYPRGCSGCSSTPLNFHSGDFPTNNFIYN